MTFWLLALILLLCLAALGYRQGAIRVAMSFLGILFGIWLASPLSGLVGRLMKPLGVEDPVALWLIPPFVAFCLVLTVFKVSAQFIHRKVEVYYKYKSGDLRMALWQRLMARMGMCLGVLNGTLYLLLISMVIYPLSYWTIQIGDPAQANWSMKLFNRLGRDMDNSGFSKTARAMESLPDSFFKAADIAGLVYQNSLLEARLSRYPAFLILGEKPEFKSLASDTTFADMRLRQVPLKEVMNNSNVDTILKNPALVNEVWSTLEPNLDDLNEYLHTGISPAFSIERIYGRWNFNPSASAASLRREQPNIRSREMRRMRQLLQANYGRAALVVGTDERMIAKNFGGSPPPAGDPMAGEAPSAPAEISTGEWRPSNKGYRMIFNANGEDLRLNAVIQGERMTVSGFQLPLVFDREV